jgi:hypothetical protein
MGRAELERESSKDERGEKDGDREKMHYAVGSIALLVDA